MLERAATLSKWHSTTASVAVRQRLLTDKTPAPSHAWNGQQLFQTDNQRQPQRLLIGAQRPRELVVQGEKCAR